MNKPEPVCPKCEADQRDRPLSASSPASAATAATSPAKTGSAQVAPLVDDEEEVPTPADTDTEAEEDTSEANPELDDAIFGGGLKGESLADGEGEQITPEDIKL